MLNFQQNNILQAIENQENQNNQQLKEENFQSKISISGKPYQSNAFKSDFSVKK